MHECGASRGQPGMSCAKLLQALQTKFVWVTTWPSACVVTNMIQHDVDEHVVTNTIHQPDVVEYNVD